MKSGDEVPLWIFLFCVALLVIGIAAPIVYWACDNQCFP